jgi:cytochrome c oxidase subunit IV
MSDHALTERSEAAPHALPPRVLLSTAAALLGLTAATVAISRLDLGAWNVAVALFIAGLKSSLVALFFMHLRYEGRFKAVIFVTALFCVSIFIGLVVLDTTQYQPEVRAATAAATAEPKGRHP